MKKMTILEYYKFLVNEAVTILKNQMEEGTIVDFLNTCNTQKYFSKDGRYTGFSVILTFCHAYTGDLYRVEVNTRDKYITIYEENHMDAGVSCAMTNHVLWDDLDKIVSGLCK